MKRGVLVALLALAALGARAEEVWGYTDAKGIPHFASEKLDGRYELLVRNEPGAGQRGAQPPGPVPRVASKLAAFFEVSPGYKQVLHHLRAASESTGVDFELLKAVIATESGFRASLVSPGGAVGLMQIMPATARRLGLSADGKGSIAQRLADPGVNIRLGARYLRSLLDQCHGRIELALAAYNAGLGAVRRAGDQIPQFPQTQKYVRTVMQLYGMLKPPAAVRLGEDIVGVQAQIPTADAGMPAADAVADAPASTTFETQ